MSTTTTTQAVYNLKRFFADLDIRGLLVVKDEFDGTDTIITATQIISHDHTRDFVLSLNGAALCHSPKEESVGSERQEDECLCFLSDEEYADLACFVYNLQYGVHPTMLAIAFGLE